MKTIRVHLKERSYEILIGEDLVKGCGLILKRLCIGKDALIVTNSRLSRLYGKEIVNSLKRAGISARFELVPDSEKAKSSQVAIGLVKRIAGYDKGKTLFIIAFGGGVIGDLAGFVAAVYKRGIPYVQIPTTLLAQVDSAIGGKVAIDTPAAKNLIGAFYQPKAVISDTALLRTLTKRQIRSGLAEVLKYGVIGDKALFKYLEKSYKKIIDLDNDALEFVVSRSTAIKAEIVARDEYDDKGARARLNYGHTIGHAIESAAGYSKTYNHGDAIAIGMAAAASISSMLRLITASEADRIEALIKEIGLPTKIKGLEFSGIYEAHLHDKKFIHGKNRFVLPTRIGSVKVVEGVSDSVIARALRERLQR